MQKYDNTSTKVNKKMTKTEKTILKAERKATKKEILFLYNLL